MTKYNIILYVNEEKKIPVLDQLQIDFPDGSITIAGKINEDTKFLIKTESDMTTEILKHQLENIDGISKVSVHHKTISWPNVPKGTTILMIGIITLWIVISSSTFFVTNNPLEQLTNFQILVIQLSIGVAISIWLFFHDKKSQNEIVDVLARLDILTNEINQNVNDVAEEIAKD